MWVRANDFVRTSLGKSKLREHKYCSTSVPRGLMDSCHMRSANELLSASVFTEGRRANSMTFSLWPFGFGVGAGPASVSTAALKSTPSRALTRAITSPFAPHPRQLNTCFLALIEKRSLPPHIGHGWPRLLWRGFVRNGKPRRASSSSIGTARAFS
jgi:hypothetical protein